MSNAQVESFAGFALLAIVVMVLCYLLPAAIRSRQIVADARIDDRFSTGLRVLARAGDTPPRYQSTGRVHLHTPSSTRAEDPHPAAQGPRPPARTGPTARPGPTARSLTSPSGEPEAPMDRQPAPPASGSAAHVRRQAALRAARAAAVSRRAAAARRRRVLLGGLFVLTAAAWTLFATITFPIAVPIVASVLLVAAGVAGRRAAVRAARAESREQAAGPDGRRRNPGAPGTADTAEPATATTAPVRHARRASQGEAAERIGAGPEGADDAASGAKGARPGAGTPAKAPTRTSISERTGSLRISVDPATADSPAPVETEEGWTPVPVPVPTYALKAAAPRRQFAAYQAPKWEPAQAPADAHQEREVTLAEVEQAVRERQDAQAPPATPEQVLAEQETQDSPRTETAQTPAAEAGAAKAPTVDLESVLERRRAVGQ